MVTNQGLQINTGESALSVLIIACAAVNRAIKRIVDAHNSEEEVLAKKQKREPIMIPRFSCHIVCKSMQE